MPKTKVLYKDVSLEKYPFESFGHSIVMLKGQEFIDRKNFLWNKIEKEQRKPVCPAVITGGAGPDTSAPVVSLDPGGQRGDRAGRAAQQTGDPLGKDTGAKKSERQGGEN
jgi:hypothetical protein